MTASICGGIYARVYCILYCVYDDIVGKTTESDRQATNPKPYSWRSNTVVLARFKEGSHSLSHLLMSFLLAVLSVSFLIRCMPWYCSSYNYGISVLYYKSLINVVECVQSAGFGGSPSVCRSDRQHAATDQDYRTALHRLSTVS